MTKQSEADLSQFESLFTDRDRTSDHPESAFEVMSEDRVFLGLGGAAVVAVLA